ncbi:hypothetical protein FSP39_020769 [Pinctada imbricata]|uniref:Uncharacterized protein n=1 Tax=Pinctada imbricata TaxID=66713 RepID=A0AA88XUQ7_PINIB|nr:hypothetical protein FSP39_020769 [Pinctada imbricata]
MRIQPFGPKKTAKRKQAFELPVLGRKTNNAKQQIQQCGPFFGERRRTLDSDFLQILDNGSSGAYSHEMRKKRTDKQTEPITSHQRRTLSRDEKKWTDKQTEPITSHQRRTLSRFEKKWTDKQTEPITSHHWSTLSRDEKRGQTNRQSEYHHISGAHSHQMRKWTDKQTILANNITSSEHILSRDEKKRTDKQTEPITSHHRSTLSRDEKKVDRQTDRANNITLNIHDNPS